jgi:hypothetical protein
MKPQYQPGDKWKEPESRPDFSKPWSLFTATRFLLYVLHKRGIRTPHKSLQCIYRTADGSILHTSQYHATTRHNSVRHTAHFMVEHAFLRFDVDDDPELWQT